MRISFFDSYGHTHSGESCVLTPCESDDFVVFADGALPSALESHAKVKVGVLVEPHAAHTSMYGWIGEHDDAFDAIFTHDLSLVDEDKYFYYPYGTTWIPTDDRRLWAKTDDVSIIASAKNYTEGHQLRHEVVSLYGDRMDVFGGDGRHDTFSGGYRAIPTKTVGLAPYRYSVVIENDRTDCYFSEKLIDCLLTGTVPLYWGFPSVKDFFIDIPTFDDLDGLKALLDNPPPIDMTVVRANFALASCYTSFADNLYYAGLGAIHDDATD